MMTVVAVAEGARGDTVRSVGRFSLTTRKARYGVSYFRTICNQAGVGFVETPPDEDQDAIDGMVKLRQISIPVQIKCSSQFKVAGPSATWPAEKAWLEKWRESWLPVYFVLVILDDDDPSKWIDHQANGTSHCSGAFWTRVDQHNGIGNISVPKAQRLTAATLDEWEREAYEAFAPGRGV